MLLNMHNPRLWLTNLNQILGRAIFYFGINQAKTSDNNEQKFRLEQVKRQVVKTSAQYLLQNISKIFAFFFSLSFSFSFFKVFAVSASVRCVALIMVPLTRPFELWLNVCDLHQWTIFLSSHVSNLPRFFAKERHCL